MRFSVDFGEGNSRIEMDLKHDEKDRLESYLSSNHVSQEFDRPSNRDIYECDLPELGKHSVSLSRNPDVNGIIINIPDRDNFTFLEELTLEVYDHYRDMIEEGKLIGVEE